MGTYHLPQENHKNKNVLKTRRSNIFGNFRTWEDKTKSVPCGDITTRDPKDWFSWLTRLIAIGLMRRDRNCIGLSVIGKCEMRCCWSLPINRIFLVVRNPPSKPCFCVWRVQNSHGACWDYWKTSLAQVKGSSLVCASVVCDDSWGSFWGIGMERSLSSFSSNPENWLIS